MISYKTLYDPKIKDFVLLGFYGGEWVKYHTSVPKLYPSTATKELIIESYLNDGYPEKMVRDMFNELELIPVTLTKYVL